MDSVLKQKDIRIKKHRASTNLNVLDINPNTTLEALEVADGLVRINRMMGLKTRFWAHQAVQITDLLIKSNALPHFPDQSPSEIAVQKEVWEINLHEGEMIRVIHYYVEGCSALINRLKSMNQILTTDQLKSYLDTMIMDRKSTMNSLDALIRSLEKLSFIKSQLKPDPLIVPPPLEV